MRYAECMVAYNPGTDQIRADWFRAPIFGQWADQPIDYMMTIGGCESDVRWLSGLQAQHRVMSDFIAVVVRDGVNLEAAYREFIKIDEFALAIPEDCDGARPSLDSA
jgi:hypothetical protein